MSAPAILQPRSYDRDGVTYQIALPSWGQWLSILDRAARGGDAADQADVSRLLRLWLGASVQVEEDGRLRPLGNIDDLAVDVADDLVAQGATFLAEAAAALAIEETHDPVTGGVEVIAQGVTYAVRPLTFGERNACLSRHIAVHAGQPEIDASAYELALVAASTSTADRLVKIKDLMALPLSLGETLVAAARRLSDATGVDELLACAQSGTPHPDLELATLCLTYGMSPAEAMALPAATARRLHVAAGLLQAAQPFAPVDVAPVEDDRWTKIVVHDD